MHHDVDAGPSNVFRHHGASDEPEDPCPGSSGVCRLIARHFGPYSEPGYVGRREEDMEAFKAFLVDLLRTRYGMTLTGSSDSLTLSTTQINIPVSVMSEAFYTLGAR